MKTLQIYDPALCCSTGVCNNDTDAALVTFAADADWARRQGAKIERFNLAQEPEKFAASAPVRAALDARGESALPLVLLDGAVVMVGAYPTREEIAALVGITAPEVQSAGASCCGPKGCC
jgi:hypothetical protein